MFLWSRITCHNIGLEIEQDSPHFIKIKRLHHVLWILQWIIKIYSIYALLVILYLQSLNILKYITNQNNILICSNITLYLTICQSSSITSSFVLKYITFVHGINKAYVRYILEKASILKGKYYVVIKHACWICLWFITIFLFCRSN